jgi:hypothetical protein
MRASTSPFAAATGYVASPDDGNEDDPTGAAEDDDRSARTAASSRRTTATTTVRGRSIGPRSDSTRSTLGMDRSSADRDIAATQWFSPKPPAVPPPARAAAAVPVAHATTLGSPE